VKEFSFRTRAANLRTMAAEPLDVLVVGGGIVGAWVTLAAASRGYRTGLVEKGDFASGTSGKTSRLVHGGLRYLQQFRVGLVRQAARERDRLLRIAPTLVKPLTFLIPIYRQRGPKRWTLRIGLWVYDLLSREKALPRRRWVSAEGALELEPSLARSGLVAAALYSDAMVNDARLVLAVVRAAHESGALVANYARVSGLVLEEGVVRGARVVDEETGSILSVRAGVVINATGVWAPDLQGEGHRLRMRPTKGVHILVPRERIGHTHAVVLFGADSRLMFAIPRGRFTLLGTTDTHYRGNRDEVTADREDIDYLLNAANAYFPDARLVRGDVVSAFAGLRPLLDSGESEESRISRRHEIVEDPDGLVNVVGGKLTTARVMAEEVLDRIRPRLPRRPPARSATRMVEVADPDAAERNEMDVARIVRNEMAVHLDDVLVRRTPLLTETVDHGVGESVGVARTMAAEMGWDVVTRDSELVRYREVVEAHRRWKEGE
jgi:glycerol-3-phosphate dehydrogenase